MRGAAAASGTLRSQLRSTQFWLRIACKPPAAFGACSTEYHRQRIPSEACCTAVQTADRNTALLVSVGSVKKQLQDRGEHNAGMTTGLTLLRVTPDNCYRSVCASGASSLQWRPHICHPSDMSILSGTAVIGSPAAGVAPKYHASAASLFFLHLQQFYRAAAVATAPTCERLLASLCWASPRAPAYKYVVIRLRSTSATHNCCVAAC